MARRRTEPYTARQVDKYLRAKGFVIVRQTGSHVFYQHDDGRMVPMTDPGSNHVIDTELAKKIAFGLGIPIAELRSDLGYIPAKNTTTKTRQANGHPQVQYTGPNVQALAKSIVEIAIAIHRSGDCFHSSDYAKAELFALESKLHRWHARNKGKAAA
jgi:predicted RNA binding protein YcfA (HicA-like mRNA interferase family)